MPRIRPASRSGWKTSRASVFSPVPRNFTGEAGDRAIERAAPPRASPSILVRTRPVTGTAAANAWATPTASWPVIASTTRSVSTGLDGGVDGARSRPSAPRRSMSRPAVSRITVSRTSAAGRVEAAADDVDDRRPGRRPVDGDVERPAEGLELVGRGRPVRVGGDEERPAAQLDDVAGELRGRRRLAGALEPDERDDRRVARQVERPVAAPRAARRARRGRSSRPAGRRSGCSRISAPTARSRTRATKSLTTLKLTSASRRARRISRMRGVDVRLADPAAAGQAGERLGAADR